MAQVTDKQWLEGVQTAMIKELTTHKAALPAGFSRERFVLNTVTVLAEMLKDKKKKFELSKLTMESMAVCLCKAAYLGLDYFNGECYAIPYAGELNFQTDYKGEIKMCKRFSQNPIKDIYAKVVREGDFFEEEIDGGVQNIKYRPRPFSNEPMIGAFAVVVFKDGSMMYDSMSKDDIENVRNVYSKAKDSQAWKSSTGEMYKKTVLRRLCKLIDLNFDNVEQRQAFYAGGDVEFENGQPVYLDDRKDDAAALPDKGVPVNVFAQQQAYREPVPAEESKAPQNSQEEDFKQFEQQYMDQQAAQQSDNGGFMEMDDAMLSGLPWK
ncbi:MAG: RecT family recombinase [Enterocloster sp.]|nr:RecT family recombinase [Enterocloster sp.]